MKLSDATSVPDRPIEEWLEEVSLLYHPDKITTLHGRLVYLGLALLDNRLFEGEDADRLRAVHDEVRRPYHELLTPRGLELLRMTPLPAPPQPDREEDRGSVKTKRDTVPTLDDQPVTVDALNRLPFARVLAKRIRRVRYQGKEGPFRVLLYGPWGSGKTSLLNFLRDELTRDLSGEADCHKEQNHDSWIVVDFNAWQHQRIGPPWWSLLDAVYRSAKRQFGWWRKSVLWIRELTWRKLSGWWRPLLGTIITTALIIIALQVLRRWGLDPTSAEKIGATVNTLSAVVTFLGTLVAAGFAFTRNLGSAKAAEQFVTRSDDPLRRIARHYRGLIEHITRPVVVFIDDLDRCRSDYTVGLLEGIQTIFRDAPVTYVVAADRCWLCECFEHDYTMFAKAVAPPGRRLGYLFIEKTFQAVAPLSRMRPEIKDKYFSGLLGLTAEMADPQVSRRAEAIRDDVRRESTEEGFDKVVQDAGDNEYLAQVARNAIAERQVDVDMQVQQEHFLQPYGRLLEPNPRAMKRLVNAYGVRRALHAIAGSSVTREKLALWTILALRWPELAEFLEHNPAKINRLNGTGDGSAEDFPEELRPLVGYDEVENVIRGEGLGGPLNVGDVRAILLQQEVGKEPAVTKTEDAAVNADSEGL